MKQAASKQCSAFTLAELLYVMAPLFLLPAMITPAMEMANADGEVVRCIPIHRQIFIGWGRYSNEVQGTPSKTVDHRDYARLTNHVAGLLRQTDDERNKALLVRPARRLSANCITDHTLYKRPSDGSRFVSCTLIRNHMVPVRAVGEVHAIHALATDFLVCRRQADIDMSSSIPVTLDERQEGWKKAELECDLSDTRGLSGEEVASPYGLLDRPGSYHSFGLVLDLPDAHLDHQRWTSPTTLVPIGVTGICRTSPTNSEVQDFRSAPRSQSTVQDTKEISHGDSNTGF
jgi:hypothetical protein